MTDTTDDPVDDEVVRSGVSPVKIIVAALGVLLAAFVVLLAVSDPQVNDVTSNVVLGQAAPAISGTGYTGESFDLDDVLRENRELPLGEQTWVVVNFFGSWCVGCIQEHPDLIRFDEEGVACPTQLVGVTFADTERAVTDFFAQRGGEWPVLVGEGTSGAVIDYGVTSAPETVIIAPTGQVVQKFTGALTYEQLVEAIPCPA